MVQRFESRLGFWSCALPLAASCGSDNASPDVSTNTRFGDFEGVYRVSAVKTSEGGCAHAPKAVVDKDWAGIFKLGTITSGRASSLVVSRCTTAATCDSEHLATPRFSIILSSGLRTQPIFRATHGAGPGCVVQETAWLLQKGTGGPSNADMILTRTTRRWETAVNKAQCTEEFARAQAQHMTCAEQFVIEAEAQ